MSSSVILLSLVIPFLLAAQAIDRESLPTKYCAACHSVRAKMGGFVLEGVKPGDAGRRPDIWEKVIRKIKAGEMPPAGAPNPGRAQLRVFTSGLERDLDAAAQKMPYAGQALVRRLNRTEYENAIHDLLAIELQVAAELPQDGIASGFDNIADALSMSPLLLERYLKVARRVSELATGTREAAPVTEVFPATGTQATWQEDMPFGTRGGIRVRHYFSHDGDYELRAFLNKESLTPIEGVRFFRTRLRVKAGAHTVVVTFPDEFAAREGPVSDVAGPGGPAVGGPLDLLGTAIRPTLEFRVDGRRAKLFEIAGMTAGEAAFDGQPGPPTLTRIEITGPHNVTGVSDTPSRRRIFLCTPASTAEEEPCATRIVSALVRRAFRRDVSTLDLRPFLKTYRSARATRSFDASIAAAIRDVLLAPDFLFRLEFDNPTARAGVAHPVSRF